MIASPSPPLTDPTPSVLATFAVSEIKSAAGNEEPPPPPL
jgi:hypothetical protein